MPKDCVGCLYQKHQADQNLSHKLSEIIEGAHSFNKMILQIQQINLQLSSRNVVSLVANG